MTDDQRTGDEAEAVVDEDGGDPREAAPPADEPPADDGSPGGEPGDAEGLAEEAEAVVEEGEAPAADTAFGFGEDTVEPEARGRGGPDGTDRARDPIPPADEPDDHDGAGVATGAGSTGRDRDADGHGRGDSTGRKSKAELDRELETLTGTDTTGDERSDPSMDPGAAAASAAETEAGDGDGNAAADEPGETAESSVADALADRESTAGDDDDLDPAVAGLLSFLVPGLGNLYNGQSGRGLVGLLVWGAWLLVGWGIGGFFFGLVLGALTYGLMFLLTGLVLVVVEFVLHVVAAYDAYSQAGKLDDGTVRV